MVVFEDHVKVLDLDEDIEDFPFRLAGLLADQYRNYYKTSVKHQLNRVWTIKATDFKLAKPFIQGMQTQNFLNLFIIMFKHKKRSRFRNCYKTYLTFWSVICHSTIRRARICL